MLPFGSNKRSGEHDCENQRRERPSCWHLVLTLPGEATRKPRPPLTQLEGRAHPKTHGSCVAPAGSPLASAILNLKLWGEIPKASRPPRRPGSFPLPPPYPGVVGVSSTVKRRARQCLGARLPFRPPPQRLSRQPHPRGGHVPAAGSTHPLQASGAGQIQAIPLSNSPGKGRPLPHPPPPGARGCQHPQAERASPPLPVAPRPLRLLPLACGPQVLPAPVPRLSGKCSFTVERKLNQSSLSACWEL